MTKKKKKPWLIVLIILIGTFALFFLLFRLTTIQVLTLSHQETGKIFLTQRTEAKQKLTFNWIHSFEHIPWVEEYTVEDDNTFVLHTIRVAGFVLVREFPRTRVLSLLKMGWWLCETSMKHSITLHGYTHRVHWYPSP